MGGPLGQRLYNQSRDTDGLLGEVCNDISWV